MLILSSIGLSISLLVESSSWTLRAMSGKSNHGFFNSRASIYLYGGRFFSLLFMGVMSILADQQKDINLMTMFISISVTSAACTQIFYKKMPNFFHWINKIMTGLIFQKFDMKFDYKQSVIKDNSLKRNTTLATVVVIFGISSPYILAAFYPEIRMTISTLGQFITAIGTVLVLFNVDTALFKKMDKNNLKYYIFEYLEGRCMGLIFASIIFWVIFLLTYIPFL